MTPHHLTGTWRGYYEQNGQRRGISMRVAQRGDSFVGAMHDDETMWVTKEELQPVDPDEISIGPVAVEMLTVLPSESTIEGEVTGSRVTFEKRYRGKHSFTVFFDHKELMPGAEGQATANAEIESHRVIYEGELDEAGNAITGIWRIPPPEEMPDIDEEQGAFLLQRATTAHPAAPQTDPASDRSR